MPPISTAAVLRHSPALIAAGLAIQIAAAWWPTAPVVTGMALVALGATGATVAQFSQQRRATTLLLAHLLIYCTLYCLFVGAVWHAATTGPRLGWHIPQLADLLTSLWPMAFALRLAFATIAGRARGEDATTR